MGQFPQALEKLVAQSPSPPVTTRRLEQLQAEPRLWQQVETLPIERQQELVNVIGISNFLHRFLYSHSDCLADFQQPANVTHTLADGHDFAALRRYKYRELLRLTRQDLACSDTDYGAVLTGLTTLAEEVLRQSLKNVTRDYPDLPLCIIALGKLGAAELNFSSDIDLIFVTPNHEDIAGDAHDYQKNIVDSIRSLSRNMEDQTAEGFLYRIDLKLRPWGRSGPLAMSVDETEQYYEGSSENWERFAWLRARVVAGSEAIGTDLLKRLQPFIYSRTLSAADLDRFLQIKADMAKMRRRGGSWNIKVGEGGIRDIEFFVQMLQLVNGGRHELLRTTNTLQSLQGLVDVGLLDADEAAAIRHSYLFLRRLENRLQMIDERQTHDLPDDKSQRHMLARSLGFDDTGGNALAEFEDSLIEHQALARSCFDRILPDQ